MVWEQDHGIGLLYILRYNIDGWAMDGGTRFKSEKKDWSID